MSSIVIALPKIEDARKIRSVLERHGFAVASVCSTASNALSSASELGSGVLICGHRLPDMNYLDLAECMPRDFEMLLLASARVICEVPPSILSVEMPMKASDLINTVNLMVEGVERRRRKRRMQPKTRNAADEKAIKDAKELLMARNHMTEEEAHRYLQKTSMDSGTNLVETAQMVLSMMTE